MSYLKFDKNLMINLEQSLPKEMLRTNQSGAYISYQNCNHQLSTLNTPNSSDSLTFSHRLNKATYYLSACEPQTQENLAHHHVLHFPYSLVSHIYIQDPYLPKK